MEINIITQNIKKEMTRVNLSSVDNGFSTITVSNFNCKDQLIDKYELPVKSLQNFLKELEKIKNS